MANRPKPLANLSLANWFEGEMTVYLHNSCHASQNLFIFNQNRFSLAWESNQNIDTHYNPISAYELLGLPVHPRTRRRLYLWQSRRLAKARTYHRAWLPLEVVRDPVLAQHLCCWEMPWLICLGREKKGNNWHKLVMLLLHFAQWSGLENSHRALDQ